MKTFELNKRNVEEELRILNDPLYRGERPKIIELISLLQQASTPADYFELQRRLIIEARARQTLQREIRDAHAATGERIRELATQDPKPIDALKEQQCQLDLRNHQERVSEALRFTLMTIGDGMAWRVLGYDRGAITVLGRGERVARFAEGSGFEAEAQAISDLWSDEKLFAIHNDLTTCLRHGDLTVPRAEEGRVDVIEVKVSEVLTDDSPQMKRMAEAVALLNEGRVTAPDGQVMRMHRINLPFRTHLASLPALVAKARGVAYASIQPSPCQFVAAIDYVAAAGQEDRMERMHLTARERLGWFDGTQKTFQYFTSARRMRDRGYSFSIMAPLSVFPLAAEDVADICMGFVEIYTVLNGSLLERSFTSHQVRAEVFEPPQADGAFLQAVLRFGDHELVVQVSPQLREQMLLELMTPANVIGAVQGLASELASEPGEEREEHIVALQDEARVWERA
jgi:hypothetical protein